MNIVILIDLDGTLKTEHDDIPPFEVQSLVVENGPSWQKKHIFGGRPHIKSFFDVISKKASEIILSTAAGGAYARNVLKVLDIDGYFSRIIASEDYKNKYPFQEDKRYIFIDNNKEMVSCKIQSLIGSSTDIIIPNSINEYKNIETWIVDTYHGSKDDRTLIELAEEINKL